MKRQRDKETGRRRDGETGRRRDGETGRRGDGRKKNDIDSPSSNPPVPQSPRPPVPPSSSNLTWRRTVIVIWNKLSEDEIFGRAAQLAYYWIFSIFPLLIFLTSLLAFLPMRRDLNQWVRMLGKVLPHDAYSLLNNTFQQIVGQQRGGLLSFSILVTLWASSSGMEAIISALNRAYGQAPARPWIRQRLLSISLTLGLAAFIISALALIFFGENISGHLAEYFGFSDTFNTIWSVAQWPIIIGLVLLGVEVVYYFAPNVRRGANGKRWELLTPGGIFAVALWLLISFGLRFYLSRFGNFNATYGALAGVMVLMLWLYLTGVAILVGGVINSVMRRR